MFITKEILESKNACIMGIKWLDRYFPEGGEVMEIMSHRHIPSDFLHWGYNHLLKESSEEERQFLQEKLNIKCDNLQTIFNSKNILNSSNIYYCNHIEDSDYVFTSQFIEKSSIVHSSKNIKNSCHIFNSTNVINSSQIYISSDIENSKNIVSSSNIKNSSGIFFGNNIIDSMYIIGEENYINNNIYSSYFIANSNNLTNCLFCCNKDSEELLIFNHPVSESEFNKYKDELLQILQNWTPNFISNWGEPSTSLDFPLVNNKNEFFKTLPQEFIIWVQSLPHYNENLFLQICNSKKS